VSWNLSSIQTGCPAIGQPIPAWRRGQSELNFRILPVSRFVEMEDKL